MAAKPTLRLADEPDIVTARATARRAARDLGFGPMDQSRIATAVSEIARNVIRYAGEAGGHCIVQRIEDGARRGLEVVITDHGPGIPDIELAMQPGYTTSRGLGLGLSGARRLMDEMEIESGPGGTVVTLRKWRL